VLEIDKIDARERRSHHSLFFVNRYTRKRERERERATRGEERVKSGFFYLCVCECDVHDCYIVVILRCVCITQKKNEVSKSNDLSLSLRSLLSSVRFVFFIFFCLFLLFSSLVSVALVCQLFALLERDIHPHFNR